MKPNYTVSLSMFLAESEIHLNLSIGSDGEDWKLAFFSHAVLNPFVPSAKHGY